MTWMGSGLEITYDPDDHPRHLRGDGPCDDCGGPNIIWHTDDLLWNRVIRDHGNECILCVHCFVERTERYYHVKCWRLTIAPEMIERFP